MIRFLPLLAMLLLAACDTSPPAATTKPVAKVPTIASLVPAATDLILGMQANDHLIAISNWDPEQPSTKGLPRVGDYRNVDWEKISNLHPAAMIVQFAPGKMPPGIEERAKAMNIKLVNVKINVVNDIFDTMAELGEALNERDKATAAQDKLRGQLQSVKDRAKDKPRVRTLLLTTDETLAAAGAGTFLNDVLTLAGGENVIEGLENSYPTLDREQVVRLNPEVILQLLPGASEQVLQKTKEFWTRFDELQAVRNGKVFILTEPYTLLPGFQVGQTAERFVERLHPSEGAAPASNLPKPKDPS